MNKHAKMIDRIIKHGENLNNIFNTKIDPIKLCKQLRRLEIKGSKISEDYCNGYIDNIEKWENLKDDILNKVNKILNFSCMNIPVFLNSDPRGYCLKIDDEYIRNNNIKIHTDFGGYGIIAPDLTEE